MVPHQVKEPPPALHLPWGLPVQPSSNTTSSNGRWEEDRLPIPLLLTVPPSQPPAHVPPSPPPRAVRVSSPGGWAVGTGGRHARSIAPFCSVPPNRGPRSTRTLLCQVVPLPQAISTVAADPGVSAVGGASRTPVCSWDLCLALQRPRKASERQAGSRSQRRALVLAAYCTKWTTHTRYLQPCFSHDGAALGSVFPDLRVVQ